MANNTDANKNYYAAILLPTYCEAENIENLIHNIENLQIKTKKCFKLKHQNIPKIIYQNFNRLETSRFSPKEKTSKSSKLAPQPLH
jgi:hypothetical protein